MDQKAHAVDALALPVRPFRRENAPSVSEETKVRGGTRVYKIAAHVRPSVRRGIASRGSTTPSETTTPTTLLSSRAGDAERPMWFPPTRASDESSDESSDDDGNVKK